MIRTIGTTGMRTPPMIFGGNVLGFTADEATSFRLLDRFVDAGGTMIDTADVYSAWVPGHRGGESETVIGRWLRHSGKRNHVLIATKVGMLSAESGDGLAPQHIHAACHASLERLGIDSIDLYYAHQDDQTIDQADVAAAFAQLIDAGKVRHLAASNFGAMRLKSALDVARAAGLPAYSVLQPEYNLVERSAFTGELQDMCVTHNIAALPYFGLASGFLTGKYRSRDDLAKSVRGTRVASYLNDQRAMRVLSALDAVVAETGATHAQVALAWLASEPGVTAPLASATSIEQLDELIGAWDLTLEKSQLDRLSAAGS